MFDWMKDNEYFGGAYDEHFGPKNVAAPVPTDEQCVFRAAGDYAAMHDRRRELGTLAADERPEKFVYDEGGCYVNYMDGTAPENQDAEMNHWERFISGSGFDPHTIMTKNG